MDPPSPVAVYGGAGATVSAVAFTPKATDAASDAPAPRGVLAGTRAGGLMWHDTRGERPSTVRLEGHEVGGERGRGGEERRGWVNPSPDQTNHPFFPPSLQDAVVAVDALPSVAVSCGLDGTVRAFRVR